MARKEVVSEKLIIVKTGKTYRVLRLTKIGRYVEIKLTLRRCKTRIEAHAYAQSRAI